MNLVLSRRLVRALAFATFVTLTLVAVSTARAVLVRTSVAYRPAYHPVVRTAAAVGAAVAVGTVVRTLPPSCTAVRVGDVAYHQCGATWYRPAYAGSAVTYTVVAPPR